MDNYKMYLEKKAGFLDKMLNLGKSTLRGSDFNRGISRPPVYNLKGHLDRSSDFGDIASEVIGLTERGERNKGSILKTYKGLFTKGHKENPTQLFRQAKEKVYSPLGPLSSSPGDTIANVAKVEVKNSIFNALSRQAHNPQVEQFARELGSNKKSLDSQIKKVMQDFAEGKDPIIHVPQNTKNGKTIALNIDRPIDSFNGSPVLNIHKTMGIDGINTYNNKHYALNTELQKIRNSGNVDPAKIHEQTKKVRDSQKFGELFEDKLRLMSSSTEGINSNKFTIDDLNTTEKIEVFLKSPHLEKKNVLLSADEHNAISDKIINYVKSGVSVGNESPQKLLVDALTQVAKDQHQVNYMDTFQFKRYSASEMKDVIEQVKGVRDRLGKEYVRAGADAAGLLGLGALGGTLGYTALKPQENQYGIESDYKTKMLQHKV